MASVTLATVQHRLRHLSLNLISFNVCYLLGNTLAQQQAVTRHVAMPFDAQIPFLQWMIVPYLSSGLFFCLGFAWVRTPDQLRVLSQRLLLATVLASFVFFLYPLRFNGLRPSISAAPYALLFDVLSTVDRPYNQLPSLHVAFCLIFWPSLQSLSPSRIARALLAGWLVLTALATLFTYQHHLMDLAAGLLLGMLCLAWIKPGRVEPNVAFYYLMAAAIILLLGVLTWHSVWALYVTLSLLLVSCAYFRADRYFLGKRQGRHPLLAWLLYAPYLLGYWLTWHAVVWRGRHQPPFQCITPHLWIGRRLTEVEAQQLPPDCTVFDLANELSENGLLRAHRYLQVPLLDLLTPPPDACRQIVAILMDETRAGRVVYMHCAMGYRRCKQLADAYLTELKL